MSRQAEAEPAITAALGRQGMAQYGLTLVLGCPLPAVLSGPIAALQEACEAAAPGLVRFGDPAAYHLTVYGLKRSRPQPFARAELAPLLEALGCVLHSELGATASLAVPLRGLELTDEGTAILRGAEVETLSRLRAAICRLPGVDPPKGDGNHVALGRLARPLAPAEGQRAARLLAPLRSRPAGTLVVRELKLVTYRSRLLDDVVSQETIMLPVAPGDWLPGQPIVPG